jgi:hypothetical protein
MQSRGPHNANQVYSKYLSYCTSGGAISIEASEADGNELINNTAEPWAKVPEVVNSVPVILILMLAFDPSPVGPHPTMFTQHAPGP